MQHYRFFLSVLLCWFSLSPPASAAEARISEIRMWHAPDRSRIVFDMDQARQFKVFSLENPDRVVVDLAQVRLATALPTAAQSGQFIGRIRQGNPASGVTRLVFDLQKPVRYFVQLLKPNQRYKYRLVVDFYHRNAIIGTDKATAAKRPEAPPPRPESAGSELLVLIDPGHGGEDPGATGRCCKEKDIVLQIAKRLQRLIDRQPGMRAALTRTGDYYVPLRRRTRDARSRKADLFISVHADAFKNNSAQGASVYALSQRGASNETARWLANRENSADLIGGVSLADKDNLLAEVLLDLSMTKTISESLRFGRSVLFELKKIGKVHSKSVEQAGFVVLKSPDIPSILVETAYITNPREEKLLINPRHQEKIAAAVAAGVRNYVSKNGVFSVNQSP